MLSAMNSGTKTLLARLTLGVALASMAGCGGGSSAPEDAAPAASASATPTPSPEPTYTPEQVVGALPTLEQVPDGERYAVRCPSDDDLCEGIAPDSGSVAVWVTPASAAAKEIGEDFTLDLVQVSVVVKKDAAAAAKGHAESRKQDEAYDGAYDIPPQKVTGGTTTREKGTGSLEDVEFGSFSGYRIDRTDEFDLPGGIRTTEFTLVSGPISLFVQARLAADGRDDDASSTVAQELLDGYLERLG